MKKQTLIWIRNWLGLSCIWKIQELHGKQLKNTQKKQNNGIYNIYHGILCKKWIDVKYWSTLRYVMLTKLMKSA